MYLALQEEEIKCSWCNKNALYFDASLCYIDLDLVHACGEHILYLREPVLIGQQNEHGD